MKPNKDTVENLRESLSTLRQIAGWSAEQLASLLGVSRVTIVTLENTKDKMSTIQYLAIRRLFDEKIREDNNKQLEWAIHYLVDERDVTPEEKKLFRKEIAEIAKGVGRKTGIVALSKALGDVRLSEIPSTYIETGRRVVDDLLTKK